jgi:hypothetical protein
LVITLANDNPGDVPAPEPLGVDPLTIVGGTVLVHPVTQAT